ncbi:FtsH-binding integral membrane protein [Enterococcus sp. PF1-24]|uniref:Bax inhibitor-1/YccA family protein n=1 Tax=unclassified Enterococcus TaxID=2608891 RepID=UPI002475D288|nr:MULTISPECIES: Bax inhibitor-1/YccA family protein [unclassified Enterococcus]MDH6364200.1 FtsH-binding integral membrane protein [Enterococcus sp. PFB1-1]MDH6401301.1 FtsH-binding integral membrane protein [Enterococcus sp. PF1-24]
MDSQTIDVGGLNRFYTKIYAILAGGILLSALVAYLTLHQFYFQAFMFVINFPLGFTGLWLVELALVLLLGIKGRTNPSIAIAGFVVYSIVNGFTLAFTLLAYADADVLGALLTAAAMFIGLSVTGIFIKKDLTGVGHAAYSALIGIILGSLLNIFVLKSGPADLLISGLSILIFSGITAYDNQRIRTVYLESNGTAGLGVAIYFALQLYLDFINLFISILRIFGKKR